MEENTENKSSNSISWTVKRAVKKRDKDFFTVLWILAITFAIVAFIFSNLISALVILSAVWAFTEYIKSLQDKDEIETNYELTLKGIKVGNTFVPYKKILRFNITEYEGVKYLVLDVEHTLIGDLAIPINPDDEDNIYTFLSQFVEEDPDMGVPFVHILAEKLGM